MIIRQILYFLNRFLMFCHCLFFSLDGKEPKDQDYQKKSENSTVRVTEILKLPRTQRSPFPKGYFYELSAGSNSQNFGRSAHRNFDWFFLKVDNTYTKSLIFTLYGITSSRVKDIISKKNKVRKYSFILPPPSQILKESTGKKLLKNARRRHSSRPKAIPP